MCGIVGVIVGPRDEKEKVIRVMTEEIRHRGPDDDGYFLDNYVALGMRRLSIIDIKTGKQPVETEDGNLLIVFNGEVYNYKELREKLIAVGYHFATDGDTEVVLNLYREYGKDSLKMLRGMFVFAIYDKKDNSIFIARDYFGIKPLYYYAEENKILGFASEIKSILRIPAVGKEINNRAVFNYLSFQYNPLKETFFKNIYKLMPGSYLEINSKSGEFREERYWNFEFKKEDDMDEESAKKVLMNTMEESVKYHMVSDVEVGSFLSGGIDSSIIATLLSKNSTRKINTFTVGFEHISEENEAVITSNAIGSNHILRKVGIDEYFQSLEDVMWHFDEPVADPSAVGLYFLAEEASKKVKVVLSGEGADELFGGYNIYTEPYSRKYFKIIPQFILRFLYAIVEMLPFDFVGKAFLRRIAIPLDERYIGNAEVFRPSQLKKLWKGDSFKRESLQKIYKSVNNESESTKMQYIDIETWLPGDILAKADKMTMAHSLELRVPFLDIGVYDFARKIPDRLKFKNGQTKYLLREAVGEVIPEETRKRRKLGFPIPMRQWLIKAPETIYSQIFLSPYIVKHLDIDYIKKLVSDHKSGKKDNSRKIYALVALAVWLRVFFEE